MANIIAVIWDFDRTLVDGYMQDPIFKRYGIDASKFWADMEKAKEECSKKAYRVNKDTYYVNYFIKCAHDGTLAGLNNAVLKEAGKEQKFYPGVEKLLKTIKETFKDDPEYSEYGIQVENYIVSTGFAETIRGTSLMPWIDGIWGCELLDGPDDHGGSVINEMVYTIDNTTKTRALFEINKGIGKVPDIDVNSQIEKSLRRVQFEHMIYIADGPSDIPAFSVVKQNGGLTFAIYPKGDYRAMQQVDQMRATGRVDMYGEADYTPDTTAYMWITDKIRQIGKKILADEKAKIRASASDVPKHLN